MSSGKIWWPARGQRRARERNEDAGGCALRGVGQRVRSYKSNRIGRCSSGCAHGAMQQITGLFAISSLAQQAHRAVGAAEQFDATWRDQRRCVGCSHAEQKAANRQVPQQ